MACIGFDCTAAIQQSAGIGRYTRELLKALAQATPTDYAYRLFAAGCRKNFPKIAELFPTDRLNWRWCPTRLSRRWLERLWYRLRLPLLVEAWTGRLDLFHAPDFVLPPVMPTTRTLVTIHDLSFVRLPTFTMPGMSRYLNRWVPHSVQRADHVIAVSEATRQDIIELYHAPAHKVTVLPHGISPDFAPVIEPARLHDLRRRYGLDNWPFILSLGTIQPRKNYPRLIQALARLEADCHLVIVGSEGWDCETVYNEVTRWGLKERVHFLGYVADADLPALYSAATIFAYPSLYEGFGLPVLEALACGTPVVAANASALPEVVGSAGLLVDPYQVEELAAALAHLLTDSADRARLGQAGQRQAAGFRWDNTAQGVLRLYDKLIDD